MTLNFKLSHYHSEASIALGSLRHSIGGAIGDTSEAKKSVDWHLVYDPKVDRWEQRAPLPTHASAPSHLSAHTPHGHCGILRHGMCLP